MLSGVYFYHLKSCSISSIAFCSSGVMGSGRSFSSSSLKSAGNMFATVFPSGLRMV